MIEQQGRKNAGQTRLLSIKHIGQQPALKMERRLWIFVWLGVGGEGMMDAAGGFAAWSKVGGAWFGLNDE